MENNVDDDNFEDLYEDGDAPKHDKLVEKVLTLNRAQNVKKPSRTESTLHISEFNLVKPTFTDKGSVRINELAQSLKKRKSRIKIGEKLKSVTNKGVTLPKPLEKPQANRIRRSVAYEKARLNLDRWEPIVTSNRAAIHLDFPLVKNVKLDKHISGNFTNSWRLKSTIDQELEKIQPIVEEYQIDTEEEKIPLTMKELLTKRKEASKLRAFQSYKEAKARRQNKIKSKKYHRIQKREKVKETLKEFENLQKTNPEEALKKLEEIEKARAEERFSLRHKSTGKWAKNKQIRAKYDKESRQVLAQQLSISRELTQKLKTNDTDEEDHVESDVDIMLENSKTDENNPWESVIKPEKEVAHFFGEYKSFCLKQNKMNEEKTNSPEISNHKNEIVEKLDKIAQNDEVTHDIQSKDEVVEQEIGEHEKSVQVDHEIEKAVPENNFELKINKHLKKNERKPKPVSKQSNSTSQWKVIDVESDSFDIEKLFDTAENKLAMKLNKLKRQIAGKKKIKKIRKPPIRREKKTTKIDLSLPIQRKKPVIDEELCENTKTIDDSANKDLTSLKRILEKETTPATRNSTDIDPKLKIGPTLLASDIPDMAIMEEAFADDDLELDFAKEKKNEVEKEKPKDINLTLPGWGSWGGSNIKITRRKRRRFTIKAPKIVPRRDDNKGSLIINEKAQQKIREHQVSEVPFPFKTVKDYEASIRAPIGSTFVPETAFRRLITPAVTTKLGTIIEPMNKDLLLNKNS